MQPSWPPQIIFSIYVTWPVSRHYETHTPESRENRLAACVTGRPRLPRRLQSQRKVTTQTSKWEVAHIWRRGRSDRWYFRAVAWQCCWVRMHNGHKTPTLSKNSTIRFLLKTGPQCQCGYRWEPSRYEAHNNFWYFLIMTLLERSVCFFCGLGVSKWIILLGLCRFVVNFLVLGQAPKSDEVQ